MSYEAECGLYWNIPRIRAAQAVSVMSGIASAFSGKITYDMADSLAEFEEKAIMVMSLYESAARESRSMSQG